MNVLSFLIMIPFGAIILIMALMIFRIGGESGKKLKADFDMLKKQIQKKPEQKPVIPGPVAEKKEVG